jgi:glycosyltransferase involved in cell wall biosynthesis
MDFPLKYSVIIPAYKKESAISEVISSIYHIFSLTEETFEIILVCDGEIDQTAQIAKSLRIVELKVLSYKENRGKGHATRKGCEEALGEVLIITDADMDLAHERIYPLIKLLEENEADLVVGSKIHPDSIVDYPPFRKILSYCYRLLIRVLFRLKIGDTQTGMKVAKNHSMSLVLDTLKIDGFAGDLEIIVAFHRMNLRILEGPVTLNYQFSSSINLNSIIKMLIGTAGVFFSTRLGKM